MRIHAGCNEHDYRPEDGSPRDSYNCLYCVWAWADYCEERWDIEVRERQLDYLEEQGVKRKC